MAIMRARSRLCADKGIESSAIEAVLEGWFTSRQSRDLATLCKPMIEQVTWKNSPRSVMLATYADLFKSLASLARNGVLPACKTESALRAAHVNRPINFTNKNLDAFSEFYGELLRAAFSKYRTLVQNDAARHRVLGKASGE